jgi:sucrose-6-phosphate hydrolase SacC (GH32 family)
MTLIPGIHFPTNREEPHSPGQRSTVFIDRRESGETDFHESFPSLDTAPVRSTSGSYDLTIFVDRCSVEVFAQGGLVTMTELIFPAKTSTALSVYATGGTATIDNLQVTQLA